MIVPLAGFLAVLIAGLAWWQWPSDADSVGPVAGTVQAAVLSSKEVSAAVGETLNSETRASRPANLLQADPPECSVAVGPATMAVYEGGWTAFLTVVHQDSAAAPEHTATQTVGRYATADQARSALENLSEGINACKSAVRAASDGGTTTKWTYRVEGSTADTLQWTATQDQAGGWSCYREARLKSSTLLQVAVCEVGDGRTAAHSIADRIAGRVQ
ncbi:sensor domain-containing protein [Kitasatospora sp. NA04385]|uniref:sensor domain-containing protein n=1 Tax=Kitasatospora sp. NA04385 TaxID=2742135 RepID=UPI0020CAC128|nr:sensor domain-containing protein [Kitasatospora sp. NA04385]